ncbi:hypothetical protein RJ640_009578 [Escallonia rubra]|uniref:Transmembrane 9 superfamily member n=1 Tax=Escallonia rubra TaxID=112253 RepID=A0AA88U705_9ASTE|nr:hypothetical protein RJ640_009578 [Escallonia rubra]
MDRKMRWCLVTVLVTCSAITPVRSDASNHKYNRGDAVPLYANKVGPFQNPRPKLVAGLGPWTTFESRCLRLGYKMFKEYNKQTLIMALQARIPVKHYQTIAAGPKVTGTPLTVLTWLLHYSGLHRGSLLETYRYFDLPFCLPAHLKEKKEALGEVLNGDRLVSAPYKLDFLVEKDSETVCKKVLSREEVAQFRSAVMKDYYFQMYYDDLPLWGFVGKIEKETRADPSESKYYLFKHLHFDVLYNKDRVIEVNVRTDPSALVDLTEDKEVVADFMYTVKWKETNISFEKRMDKYSQSSSLPHHLEIHWFSIINSCVTVLLLTGFLATILMRVLKNDFVKYAHDEETAEDQEETGWKYIHGDVFRYPKHNSLFAAALGSGTQLFTLAIFIFILALVGVFYPYNRGALFTALVVIYALTSGIAGYTGASYYCQLEGTNWVRNLLLTGSLFCGPLFLTFCFLNTVAIAYSATAALPFGTIVVIVLIWALVTSPLLVLGGIAGKNSKAEFQAPCRTTKYPREIPPLPWYRGSLPQMAMAGFLPFSAIYIELYYIFASVWGHRIYTIYSILFIVFIILLIVTAFITVALTYFQLAAEDHEWWWSGSDVGVYQYLHPLARVLKNIFPLWRIDWIVHLWLLLILLLRAIRHDRLHADFVLLRVHGLHLLRFLSHAWYCRFPCGFVFCSSYIPLNQVRVTSRLGVCETVRMEKMMIRWLGVAMVVMWAASGVVRSDSSNHKYKTGEEVPLYANKVGPFHNPRKKLRRALFMVGEIGGNDYNNAFFQGKPIQEVRTYIPHIVNAIVEAVREVTRLVAVRDVVPGNSPVAVGCIPNYLTTFRGAECTRDRALRRYQGPAVPCLLISPVKASSQSETYRYLDLPFCSPANLKEKKEALGEVLNGDRLVVAPYKLDFLVEKNSETVCKKTLTKEEVAKFRSAVAKDYYFQMYYDDLPVWGFLGKVDKEKDSDPSESKYYLFKHLHFEILYNNDRVIEINARTDSNALVDLTEDKEVEVDFMYTVEWKATNTPFEKRMDKYSQSSSLPHHLEIHWFSIINSCVTVLLLTGFLATILMRVLKNDFVKYAHDEEADDDQEESGWKYIHGDVFRYPKHKSLFAAALGSGTQLFTLAIFIFILSLVGVFYPYNRGALFTALVVIYALTSGIAGYTASSFYHQLEGTNWVRNLLLTGCLFCGPLFLTFCFLNTVAIIYSATAALPFGTIVVIVLIWTLVTSPLLVMGGIAGKNSKADFQAPCRTTKYPREIPPLPWYRETLPQMAMAGFLPFSAIYIELYYIFASVWGHRIYTIYSILFIVFIILLIVTAFITVALTYFQLAAEDHEWWWRSFLCGGSTGLFIYGYCLYYYYMRSDMSGFMQTSFFFGYMACICYGFFLMLGAVGFRAALFFVRHIYRSIKCE